MIEVNAGGKDGVYEPAPEGLHLAVCIDVVDRGIVEKSFDGKVRRVREVEIIWEIDEQDSKGRNFRPRRRFTASIFKQAALRKFLVPWRGRDFTPDEEKSFDLEKLVGVPCQLQIAHRQGREGRVWANVLSALPLMKGTVMFEPQEYVRMKDRQPDTPDHQETEADPDTPPF